MTNGRKGQALDIIALVVIIIVLGLGFLFVRTIMAGLSGDSAISSNTEFMSVIASTNQAADVADSMSIFVAIAGIIIAGGLAFFVRASPVGIIAFIFIGLVIVLIAPTLSNVYTGIAGNSVVAAQANQMTTTNQVVNAFPTIAMVGILVVLVAFFGKPFLFGGQ